MQTAHILRRFSDSIDGEIRTHKKVPCDSRIDCRTTSRTRPLSVRMILKQKQKQFLIEAIFFAITVLLYTVRGSYYVDAGSDLLTSLNSSRWELPYPYHDIPKEK